MIGSRSEGLGDADAISVADTHEGAWLVGVDGCPTGWVAAFARCAEPHLLIDIEVHTHIETLIERVTTGEIAVLAIDMPMGLPDAGPRNCDVETRSRLGRRGSSVFPTPIRPLLHCTDHARAVALGRSIDGRGISIQAFNLLPKIAQLDTSIRDHHQSNLFDRIFEAHPEAAFADLAGEPLTSKKRTSEGRLERLALLEQELPGSSELLVRRVRGAAADDVLDAAVLVRTARRILEGTANLLGDGTADRHGIPMRVAI